MIVAGVSSSPSVCGDNMEAQLMLETGCILALKIDDGADWNPISCHVGTPVTSSSAPLAPKAIPGSGTGASGAGGGGGPILIIGGVNRKHA